MDDAGDIHRAVPLRNLPQLVAGDRVHCEEEINTAMRVVSMQSRATQLARPDRKGQSKPLAANITHLAIVCANPPGIERLLIDQFCVAAEVAGMGAIIVINKSDLLDDAATQKAQEWLDVYRRVGYTAILMNTKTPEGVALLNKEFEQKSVALVGASGVGKSSIVQQILPDREIRVGAISSATGFGSHTTTVTYWYDLPGNGALIDSPGVRQFSVAHLKPVDVNAGFIEIYTQASQCKFGNCMHKVEPDCAVRLAVESGEIARWRYENYLRLLDS